MYELIRMFCNMVKETYILRKIPPLPVPFLIGLLLSSFAGGPLNLFVERTQFRVFRKVGPDTVTVVCIREALTYE